MEETLKLLHSVTLTDEQVGTAADAMEYLVAVLGVVAGFVDDDLAH
jgi:allophanate hydrolase subunit 1